MVQKKCSLIRAPCAVSEIQGDSCESVADAAKLLAANRPITTRAISVSGVKMIFVGVDNGIDRGC
jgi:hypothetical protein